MEQAKVLNAFSASVFIDEVCAQLYVPLPSDRASVSGLFMAEDDQVRNHLSKMDTGRTQK